MMVLLLLATAARAEQKNVKLLTGLTDSELQRTMHLMRAAMGTHCDYCHVVKEEKGWDWASDEKPAKRRARKMIEMVIAINRDHFGGQAVVTCVTCHRGSPKPVTLVELPQPTPKFPTPIPEKPQLPEAKEVVAKYAAALGDASRLKLPRVVKGERTKHDGSKPFEFTEQNDPAADWFALVAPSEIAEDAKTIAKENDAWVVKSGNQRLYFDTTTGLLVRRVVLTPRAIGTIPQQTDYEDYRDAGGVKFPFRIRALLIDPWMSVTRQYSAVEIGGIP